MPWKVNGVMDQRIGFILAASQPQANLSALCRQFGISRRTGYKWLARYAEAGNLLGLQEHSRRPHHSPRQSSAALEEAVMALRQQYGWGARKLEVLLGQQGITAPEWTINRILKRRGMVPPATTRAAPTRFCRAEPNQLWQMDFKGDYPLADGTVYPLVVLDDHSRYLLGLWPLAQTDAVSVRQVLEALFRAQGMPQELLTDHGIPWWGNANYYGLSGLSVWLMRQGTRLHWSGRGHPQTQGKAERQNRTLKARTAHAGLPRTKEAWWAWAQTYRQEYNAVRPHEALQMRTPGEVWTPVNLRPYQPAPPPWDYGQACTGQIDARGRLTWEGRRHYVCEALAGERVRVDVLAETLLITFCNTTLRQIDLRSGRSQPVTLARRFS